MSPADPRAEVFITECLDLARCGRGDVEPNPMVGALVVRDGKVVGRGFHGSYGGPHAEIEALRAAGPLSYGADLWVSLEPCSSHGKTPPCTEAIIAAGLRRVSWAIDDPDERHRGRARAELTGAGIECHGNLAVASGASLLADFERTMRGTLPYTVAKWAQTLDGRIADRSGRSKWISGEAARRRAHDERARADGVLVGVSTVLADDPELTVRHVAGRSPARLILDSHLRTPPAARICSTADVPTTVFCLATAPDDRRRLLEDRGVQVVTMPDDGTGRVDIRATLAWLRREAKVGRLLVEGGGEVLGGLMGRRLVDRVLAFIAPLLMADAAAVPSLAGTMPAVLSELPALTESRCESVGADWLVSGFLSKSVY